MTRLQCGCATERMTECPDAAEIETSTECTTWVRVGDRESVEREREVLGHHERDVLVRVDGLLCRRTSTAAAHDRKHVAAIGDAAIGEHREVRDVRGHDARDDVAVADSILDD